MLRFIQRKLNKYWIQRIDPEFEFVFVGMDSISPTEELDMHIKMVSNLNTVDEIRMMRGDKPLKDKNGDFISSGTYLQNLTMKQQQQMEQEQNSGIDEQQEEENPFDVQGDEGGQEEENPFVKAFEDYTKKLK